MSRRATVRALSGDRSSWILVVSRASSVG